MVDAVEPNVATQGAPGQPNPPLRTRRPWLERLRRWPVVWSLVGTAAFVTGAVAGWPDLTLGVLLAIPLVISTAGLGWRSALPLLPIGFGLVWLVSRVRGVPADPWGLLGLAAATLLACVAGHNLFALWHASDRRARADERRARLLSQATLELQGAADEDALYVSALRLLSDILTFGHAEVFEPWGGALRLRAGFRLGLPAGFVIPLDSIMGRAFRSGEAQYVADTALDEAYVTVPELGAARSELTLPIRLDGRVHAVLNLEHDRPDAFGKADHHTLTAFCRIIEDVLSRLRALEEIRRQRAEQAFVARLTQRLLQADSAHAAALATLTELLDEFAFGTGAVAVLQAARLRPLAVYGEQTGGIRDLVEEGIPFIGLMRTAWTEREPVYVRDCTTDLRVSDVATASGVRALAIVPITNARREVQALLLLADSRAARDWGGDESSVLEIVATSLGVALDRATLHRQLVALLDTVRGLAQAEKPEELYGRAAEAAVQLIPGAEAASILVRAGDSFRYAAASGYDLAALESLDPLTQEDALAWYRDGEDAYRRGAPRVVSGEEVRRLSTLAGGSRGLVDELAARVHDIHATLTVPITDHGEVVATLNVDSFSDERAFGSSAMRLAEAFGHQIAVIVKQTKALGDLRRSAVTDALTGLGNREGFQSRLDEELARAQRYRHALSLVLIDLDNFKRVNDTLGHHAGDRALIEVAEILRRQQRTSDSAFRWGGDEFVMLLPEVGAEMADRVAARYCGLIESLEFGGVAMHASIGIASYPNDGTDREMLLRHADNLMYGRKQAQEPPSASPHGPPTIQIE